MTRELDRSAIDKFADDGDTEASESLRDTLTYTLFDYVDDGRIIQYFDE